MSDGPTPADTQAEREQLELAAALDQAVFAAAARFCSEPSTIGAVNVAPLRSLRPYLHMAVEDAWRREYPEHRARRHA